MATSKALRGPAGRRRIRVRGGDRPRAGGGSRGRWPSGGAAAPVALRSVAEAEGSSLRADSQDRSADLVSDPRTILYVLLGAGGAWFVVLWTRRFGLTL